MEFIDAHTVIFEKYIFNELVHIFEIRSLAMLNITIYSIIIQIYHH